MSSKTFLLIFCTTIGAVVVAGCRREKAAPRQTEFESGLTNADSAAVVHLADVFFEYLEREAYEDAAAMLYKIDLNDVHAEPQVLDQEEMQAAAQSFAVARYYGHRVDYIKFSQRFLNEMRCSAIVYPAADGMPEVTLSYYFKPVEYLGGWVLCLMNSDTGDQTFVKDSERDSLTRLFNEEAEAAKE